MNECTWEIKEQIMFQRNKTAIVIIASGGILVSLYLVISEVLTSDFCPKYLNIPACYVVLIAFILVAVSCFLRKKALEYLFFYSGSTAGLLLAVWFSYHQLNGLKQCPIIAAVPLCYASLLTFLALFVLRLFEKEK